MWWEFLVNATESDLSIFLINKKANIIAFYSNHVEYLIYWFDMCDKTAEKRVIIL